MDQRIAAPDEGEWGWHRPLTLMPMESALSFLGRLAQAKAAPSTAAFCTDQGLRYDDLRRGEPQAVARLAAWGGIEPERLLHQTCRRISEVEVEFLGITFPESMLALTQNRICPACLRDDVAGGLPGYAWPAVLDVARFSHLPASRAGDPDLATGWGGPCLSGCDQ